jgi:hypothetical protein
VSLWARLRRWRWTADTTHTVATIAFGVALVLGLLRLEAHGDHALVFAIVVAWGCKVASGPGWRDRY